MEDKFLMCDCGCEAISICHDDELKEFYLSMWSRGTILNKIPLMWRLRYAWKILARGKLNIDEVVLTYNSARELVKYITDNDNHYH